MNVIQTLHALGPIDVRGVRRDSLLSWMILLPVIGALVLRWGLPFLNERLIERYAFDLTPYYPALLGYFFVMTPVIFGTLVGFLLLDEKDDQTLIALQVTPLSLPRYLAYRIAVPVVLAFVMVFVIFPLAGLSVLPLTYIAVIGIVAAPLAPLLALYLAAFAQNKVQGFALVKLSGVVLMLPVIAFFVQSPWDLAFGIIPTFWLVNLYWKLETGQSGVWIDVLVALIYQSIGIGALIRRFDTVMHR
jgi:fluoroquinolone transport system permease protein